MIRKTLSDSQRESIRTNLIDREHVLQDDLEEAAHTADIEDDRGDEGDQASAAIRQSMALSCRSRETRELQLIEAALERMETGDYGNCCDCSAPIDWARLHALPFAERCIGCQESAERRSVPQQSD